MKFEVMEITPEMAKEFLKKNESNRKPSNHWINELASIMGNGLFMTTHQGIAFMHDGTLIDGQQRLYAIIKSGTTQKLLVCTYDEGVSIEDIYLCIDGGRTKSTPDRLVFKKSIPEWMKSSNAVALVKRLSQIYLAAPARSSPEYHLGFCEDNLEALENFERDVPGAYRLLSNVSASLFAAYVSGVDVKALMSFLECYKDSIVDTNYGYRYALALKEPLNDKSIRERTKGAVVKVHNAIYAFVKNLKSAKHNDNLIYGEEYFAEQKKAVSVAADTAKEKEV